MTNQQAAPEALPDPSPDKLRAIARTARNSSGGASDDCGPLAYVLHGWRAAAIAFRAQQATLVDAQQPATHVQDQAEIEHVAGDVSKNAPESDMAQQPSPSAAADRAARAPADSVTAPAATPAAASIAWTALRDLTDPLGEAGVKIMGHVRIYAQRQYEAGLTEGRATPPAQAADSVLDAARLAKITQAIRDYHFALDCREHGGVAMARAWNAICDVLNMDWVQGAESAARKQEGA